MWSVNTWTYLLEPVVRSLMVMGWCTTTTFLLLCPPKVAACSAQAEFLWFTVLEAGLELTLRHLASRRQSKEDLQTFLDCSLGNPVTQSTAFQRLSSLLPFWIFS